MKGDLAGFLAGKKDTLVLCDMFAEWCGPCKMLAPILKSVEAKNDRVAVVAVDVDEHLDLARQYGVGALPTVVAFWNGKEVGRFMGLRSEAQIGEFVAKHMPEQ